MVKIPCVYSPLKSLLKTKRVPSQHRSGQRIIKKLQAELFLQLTQSSSLMVQCVMLKQKLPEVLGGKKT